MSANDTTTSLLPKIAGYTEILSKDPKSTVFVPLCDAYQQMGLIDDALEVARKGVEALPRFSPGLAILGRIYGLKGETSLAIDSFEKALQIDDQNLTALKGLISIRMQRGEKEEARSLLERVVVLRPEDQKARELLGRLGSSPVKVPAPSKRQSEAPEDGQEDAPISTTTIAEIYVRQGFLKRAMKVYRDILQVDPQNEEVRRKLVLLKNKIEAEESQEENTESLETEIQKVSPPPELATESLPSQVANPPSTFDAEIEALNRHLEAISRRRQHVQ